MKSFDVVVVGAGHAGIEAACAAFRMKKSVLLVTFSKSNIGEVSCNPAVGGIGKGTVVKEIDALDGVMPKVADESGINFKVLNRSRGPAVWGLRAQIDRAAYKKNLLKLLERDYSDLEIIEDVAEDVLVENGVVVGVFLQKTGRVSTKSLIITTGTFLSGVMHRGFNTISGGRINEPSAEGLTKSLEKLGLPVGRLKTGTTPRLLQKNLCFDGLEKQSTDEKPMFFSAFTQKPSMKQVDCFITYTNQNTHNTILSNKDRSPVFTKKIEGRGPRYCVCIEDKLVRFADKERHQVFLEPEGLDTDWFYTNGITTSMPEDVQLDFLRTIKGLESVDVVQYGYAVSYCFVNPTALLPTLETKSIKNLFLAGQINGTTGYEEAAGQGIVAGINAALRCVGSAEFVLNRTNSYIGVMINDITTNGIGGEPYRVFTSRAEYRLRIRADNAYTRLLLLGVAVGCVGDAMFTWFEKREKSYNVLTTFLETNTFLPNDLSVFGFKVTMDGKRRSLADLLRAGFSTKDLLVFCPDLNKVFDSCEEGVIFEVLNDVVYKNYVKRQDSEVEKFLMASKRRLPSDFDYSSIRSLSNEEFEKLSSIRPSNIQDASKIPGITPSAIVAIMYALSKEGR